MNAQNEIARSDFETTVVRKAAWRIIPFCFVLYIVSYMDRANIGYAALQMNKELGLSGEAFGFASGIFFIGYFLCEIPSNILMNRVGARLWITRILLTWGLVSVCTSFITTEWQLYVMRFLLGVCEAGFFPCLIFYLTGWFRAKEQATTISLFTAAIPVSYLVGAPFSTAVMGWLNNVWGMGGWRWMLLVEGAPALIGGIVCFLCLPNTPADARWLSPAERSWLEKELAADRVIHSTKIKATPSRSAITNSKVLYLAAIYFSYQCGSLGIGYWMPQIIKGFGKTLTTAQIGFVAMVPYAVATVGMILWSRHSDKKRERKFHAAIPLLIAGICLAIAGITTNPFLSIFCITITLTGLYAFKAPFWAVPSQFLPRDVVSVSAAVINSIGNLGGFVGPYFIGVIKGWSGHAETGLLSLAVLVLASFAMMSAMRIGSQDHKTTT
ncbi:MFS transporter [Acetobacter thailandicus]|uniref:MFS transporter n=1 Tax=Acetobacter thailandicus TaxID=1502842 RepID=A0ABT3QCN6_9PROT|nr:MFS transporter [Acetobacter thailandicus]MCX2563031.1 MFS transporter [Acetobacter thailandicus]NHN96295.1 MFS transporter [Acetobacter thailandicus]